MSLLNNDGSEEITLPLTFDPLPKLKFSINNVSFDAVFDTGAAYVTIGVFDTAKAVNIEKFQPYKTNGINTFYKDVELTLEHFRTVSTYVSVCMRPDCVPPYIFFDRYCVKFSDKKVTFKPKNNMISNQFTPYVDVEHKTDKKKLRLPAFKFSINNRVFDAIFDTGSTVNVISHKTWKEIDTTQFRKLPKPCSLPGESELFDRYSCQVILADIATQLNVCVGDAERLELSSVSNAISALDYLNHGWSFTFCDNGAAFNRGGYGRPLG